MKSKVFSTDWKQDHRLHRIAKNAGILISGDVIESGLSFLAIVLTARSLDAEAYGMLALLMSYIAVVSGLVDFQSWQTIIKYGAEEVKKAHMGNFTDLVRCGFGLDCATALIGAIIAFTAASIVGQMLQWPREVTVISAYYGLIIMFRITGTPTAIIRLYNKFKLFSFQRIFGSTLRLLGVVGVIVCHGGFTAFVIVWAVSDIVSNIILLIMALRILRKNNVVGIWRGSGLRLGDKFPGIWSFLWNANLDGKVRVLRNIDVLLVGGLLSIQSAGLYKVGRQVAALMAKIVEPFYLAIYPELTSLAAKKDKVGIHQLVLRSGFALGFFSLLVWIGFLLVGKNILILAFGREYLGAFWVAAWSLSAIVVWAFTQPMTQALLSLGYARLNYRIHLAGTVLYLVALSILTTKVGVSGSAFAYLLFHLLWFLGMEFAYWQILHKEQKIGTVNERPEAGGEVAVIRSYCLDSESVQ